jgi:cell division protein FtsX
VREAFFIKRAYVNFFRNFQNNFSSIINVAVVSFFALFLLFILENAISFIEKLVSSNSAIIILKEDSSSEDIGGFREIIRSEKIVESFRYISPEEAFSELNRTFSLRTEAIDIKPEGVLPPIFEIRFYEGLDKESFERFIHRLRQGKGFKDIRLNMELLEISFKIKRYSILYRIVLYIILCISSFYILSNTIGLNLNNNRREEIELVELLGGDYIDLRVPYVLEGLIVVSIGFCLGLLVAVTSTYLFVPLISSILSSKVFSFTPMMISWIDATAIFIILLVSGVTGVIRFIRRFIRGLYEEDSV